MSDGCVKFYCFDFVKKFKPNKENRMYKADSRTFELAKRPGQVKKSIQTYWMSERSEQSLLT